MSASAAVSKGGDAKGKKDISPVSSSEAASTTQLPKGVSWLLSAAQNENVVLTLALVLIYIQAFACRLFSVLRFESVIHEFDPYFNFRSTRYLVDNGFYNFHNWFDPTVWYPLGRITGATIYPGLMFTGAFIYWFLNAFNITIAIRNVCVMTAPFFASNTAMIVYLFGKEITDTQTGLVSSALVAIVPGYISRSVAGSYDNEAVAIFALLTTFFLWVKAINTGSLFWACSAALAYYYMVAAWGGYIFIINLIPLYVLVLLLSGRYSARLYVAYSTFYILGTMLSMQVSFVGFQPVQSSEHIAAFGIFCLLQIYVAIQWVKEHLSKQSFEFAQWSIIGSVLALFALAVVGSYLTGYRAPWTGRFYTLLDPTFAKEHIPIISSVSEHQPTTWSSFFFDLHVLTFLFPAGMYFCFARKLTDANIFLVMYGITSVYFTGVMVRLMLVLAPSACMLSAIAISATLKRYMAVLKSQEKAPKKGKGSKSQGLPKEIALVVVVGIAILLIAYVFHCTWVTSEAYSSPSIVLAAKQHDGSRVIFDDFREAYWWLRYNTPANAKVMSWWDYGYQISAMANRTVIVDNNTWNNSHIALVGKAMSLPEEKAYPIMRELDVDYVLVVFGGMTGYASDDINKFLWMVRISGGEHPEIKEPDYYSPQGEFRIDSEGSPVMLNTLMYKMCYYRFDEVMTEYGKYGYDRVRNAEIGNKGFDLTHIEEAYTTMHWIVRIYKVKPLDNRL